MLGGINPLMMTAGGAAAYGSVWVARETNRAWQYIACSADGTKAVAVVFGGGLYTTADGGANWTLRSGAGDPKDWSGVGCSADGSVILASAFSSALRLSTDSGASWSNVEISRLWTGCAVSADGTKMAASVTSSGNIYISTDAGASFASRASARNWQNIVCSDDFTKILSVADGNYAYLSTDSGVTFSQTDTIETWRGTGISGDGLTLLTRAGGGSVRRSIDAGSSWSVIASADPFQFAVSYDGQKIVIPGSGSALLVSTDRGASFVSRETSRSWSCGCMSNDGSKIYAAVNGGQIYVCG